MISTLPNIPTDNLYKFKAIAGLLFCILTLLGSFYILYIQFEESNKTFIELKEYNQKLRLDSTVFNRYIRNLDLEFKSMRLDLQIKEKSRIIENRFNEIENPKKSKRKNPNEILAIKEAYDSINQKIKINLLYDSLNNLYFKKIDSILNKSNELYIKGFALTSNLDFFNSKDRILKIISYGLFFFFLLSIIFTIKSFREWYERHQKYQDIIIKNEAINSKK